MTTTINPRPLETRRRPEPMTLAPTATGPGRRSPSLSLRPSLKRVSSAGFDVVLHEGAHRAARVILGIGRLAIVVADQGGAPPMADDLPVATPGSSTTVWAHGDGSLSVRASWGPPALLVRGAQVVMLPEVPGTTGQAMLGPGDRLVVLSSAAYESAPQEIVRLLHEDPPGLARAEGAVLLSILLGGVPGGGGAVVTRRALSAVPTDGRSAP